MKKTPFWKEVISHVNDTYKKIKGFNYPFHGKDLASLKWIAGNYQPWGLMALWDMYIEGDNEWAKKRGFCVDEFRRQLPCLVDVYGWKERARIYEVKLNGAMPKNLELFAEALIKTEVGNPDQDSKSIAQKLRQERGFPVLVSVGGGRSRTA